MKKGWNTVTVICLVLTIAFYNFFNYKIAPLFASIPALAPIIGLLASTSFYISLFRVFLWIYETYLEDRFYPNEAVLGQWFYRIEVKGREDDPLFGIFEVEKRNGEFSMKGVHYHPVKKRFTSRFNSEKISLGNNQMFVFYNSAGGHRDIFLRKGILILNLEGVPPKRMYGVWSDILPIKNTGELVMQKMNKDVEKLLVEIGFPRDSYSFGKMLSGSNEKKEDENELANLDIVEEIKEKMKAQ